MRSSRCYYESILFLCLLLDGLVCIASAVKFEAEEASFQTRDMSIVSHQNDDGARAAMLAQFQTGKGHLKWPSVKLGTTSVASPPDAIISNSGHRYVITISYLPIASQHQQPLDLIIQRQTTKQELIADPTLADSNVIHYLLMNPNPEDDEMLVETHMIQLRDGLYEFRLQRPEAFQNSDDTSIGPNIDFLEIDQEDVYGSVNSSPSIINLSSDGKKGTISQSTNTNQQEKLYYYNSNRQGAITLAALQKPEGYWSIQRQGITAEFEEGDLPEILVKYQVHRDLSLNEIEYTIYTSDCTTIVDDSGVVSSSISFEKQEMDASSASATPLTKHLLLSIDINESELHRSNIWQQQEQDGNASNGDGVATVTAGDGSGRKMTGTIMLCARIDLISSTTTTQHFVFRQSKSLLETSWLQPLHMSTSFGLQPFEIAQIQDEMLLIHESPNFDNLISACICNKKYECIGDKKNKLNFQVNSQLHICLRTTSSNQNVQIQHISNWILEQELPSTSKSSSSVNNLMMYFTAIEDSTPNALTTVNLLHENADGSTVEDSDQVTNLAFLTTPLIVEFFETDDGLPPNDIHVLGSVELSFSHQAHGRSRRRRSTAEFSAALAKRRRWRKASLPRPAHGDLEATDSTNQRMLRQRDLESEDGEIGRGDDTKVYEKDRMSETVLSDVFEMTISLEPSSSSAGAARSILPYCLPSLLMIFAVPIGICFI